MQNFRCQCGNAQFSGTDWPHDCQGCDDCGTTYAQRPGDHKPRIPHDPKPQFNQNTGKPDKPYCRRCYQRLSENGGAE